MANNYCAVSLLSVVSKILENLVSNKLVDYLEKCDLFSDFLYCFRSSCSTADLLAVVSNRITKVLNRSGTTLAIALDISRAFNRVWHAGLLHRCNSYGILGQVFGYILPFFKNRWL